MRLNKFIAQHTLYSRRSADTLIQDGRVLVNGEAPLVGQEISESDSVTIDGKPVAKTTSSIQTIMLNKPRGYVCSRRGQGSKTIYELLPSKLQHLQTIGRLDKESTGLILLTNDGELANSLTHPRYQKIKMYEVILDKPLQPLHHQMINDHGIKLTDGLSRLILDKLDEDGHQWRVTMHEGRNRQIRRTFHALGYNVTVLHRTVFGSYTLNNLQSGQFKLLAGE